MILKLLVQRCRHDWFTQVQNPSGYPTEEARVCVVVCYVHSCSDGSCVRDALPRLRTRERHPQDTH